MSADASDVQLTGPLEAGDSSLNAPPAATTSGGIAWDAVLAEFVAMLLFVYIGCGASAAMRARPLPWFAT